MATSTATSRTAAALQARHRAAEAMIDRVDQALGQMSRERATMTVAAVARRAAVSRTFLYQNPQARALVEHALAETNGRQIRDQEVQAAGIEATWRERALNAEEALKLARGEITMQRNTIAELLGRIRDLEHDLPEDGIQRVITENTTLKHQLRQLNQDTQRLQERLRGARDNARFLDKRVADLEAQLLDQTVSEALTP